MGRKLQIVVDLTDTNPRTKGAATLLATRPLQPPTSNHPTIQPASSSTLQSSNPPTLQSFSPSTLQSPSLYTDPMRVRATVFERPNSPFSVETLDLEPPRAGEVLVRMKAVGVCHSDYHLVTGATAHPTPCVVGHEGAGIVEAVGDGTAAVKPGDRIALSWAPNCGGCFYCRKGRPSLCQAYVDAIWAGTMLDGSTRLSRRGEPVYHYSALACFAEYAVVPEQCCVPLPSELPWTSAAMIGCAVTTGVGAILNTAKVEPGSSVAVFGVGGVGLSALMGARVAGASTIIAVDPLESRLAKARELGATHTFLPLSAQAGRGSGGGVLDAIRAATEGRGADYVIEAVGVPAVQETCLEAARPGGTVVLSGIAPMGSGTNFPGAILTRQEKTVMGSYYGTANPARDFPHYAEMALDGRLPLDKLVTRTYTLDQINEAYADMLAGRTARGAVVFG